MGIKSEELRAESRLTRNTKPVTRNSHFFALFTKFDFLNHGSYDK